MAGDFDDFRKKKDAERAAKQTAAEAEDAGMFFGPSPTEKKDLRVTGLGTNTNQTLEKAARVDDFFELGMLMCQDALTREESCGGHFRSEYQTDEGEALRNDDDFAHVTAWEWSGDPAKPIEHREKLEYEVVKFATRSYK